MAMDIGVIFLCIFVPLISLTMLLCFYCMCRRCCQGRRLASQATALPHEEAIEIINAMQGDWDVTFKPGAGSWRHIPSHTYFERLNVTGSKIKRVHAGSLSKNPAFPSAIQIKPKRSTDGDLILDSLGDKAIVFTPEQGTMEIEMNGWKSEWRRVGYQQVASSGSGGIAEVASSGSGGIADEIMKLNELRQQAVLSEEEFLAAKNRLIYPDQYTGAPSSSYDHPPSYPDDLEAGLPLKSY